MNPQSLDVGVVIVSYRTAQLVITCLESLDKQRLGPGFTVRVVVVDNASGDALPVSRAVAQRGWGEWVTVIDSGHNGGFAFGNNRGMRKLRERGVPHYYHVLNPDTEVLPGAVAELVSFLEANPSVGLAGGSFRNSDGSPWCVSFRFPGLVSQMLEGMNLGLLSALFRRWIVSRQMTPRNQPVDWLCGASMLVRAPVIEATGGMDENYFLYFEETDFCRRALLAGFPSWYVPASLVMHHSGASTQVTGADEGRKRLPAYWFASRRRYFAAAYGTRKAMLIDVVAILSLGVGHLKRLLLGRMSSAVPFLLRDLIRESILWPRNRALPPAKCTATQKPDL